MRFELRPGKPEYFPFETQLRTKAGINGLKNFHYVYILVSESDETRHYTGVTENAVRVGARVDNAKPMAGNILDLQFYTIALNEFEAQLLKGDL